MKTEINYLLKYSNRKSYSIEVFSDKKIVIRAPFNTSSKKIEELICKKQFWIEKQVKHFNSFDIMPFERKFVDGENYFYLGKKYQLKVIKNSTNNVELVDAMLEEDSFLVLFSKNCYTSYLEKVLNNWLHEKAIILIGKLLDECWKDFSFKTGYTQKPDLRIKKMKKNWGKINNKGVMTLNLNLIKTEKECIKYVINHELCHLVHFNHSKDFYSLQDQITPYWREIKSKLERSFFR